MLSGINLNRQSYDPLLRLHGKRYLNGNLVTYTFDRAGQQTTVQDTTGITSYSYYRNGTQESVVYPSGKALTYSYSRAQQRIGMVDPDGGLTTWSYSPSYGVTKIVAPGGVSATITRTGYQNYPIATLMGNGVTMTRSVMIGFTDPLEAIRTYSYAGTALAAYSPTYDPVYNKTVIAELDNVTTFTYDPARQLIGEVRSGISNTGVSLVYSLVYSYDTMGNRVQMIDDGQVTAYSYNTSNQLLEVTPPTGAATTNSYDNNGNLILQNTGGALTTYTWDQENRLISVAVPSTGLTTYVYSDDGHRQATISSAGTTSFIYDGDIVLQEINPSGIITQYAQGPGTWGLLLARNSGGTIDYYGPDDQQNVRLYLSNAGAVAGAYYTDAFGNIISGPSLSNNFIWTGNVGAYAEFLTYYRLLHRLVDAKTGRFINDDPLDFEGGSPNWRKYADNNPVTKTDPSGLACCGPDVTRSFGFALHSIDVKWRTWSANHKAYLCSELVNPYFQENSIHFGAFTSWDILELHNSSWIQSNYYPVCANSLADPSADCDRSVTIGGNCYYAGSANYATVGKMFRLCNEINPLVYNAIVMQDYI